MADLGLRQVTPVEGLVLPVVLAERERGHGLGHLIAEVEGVAGIDVGATHLGEAIEQCERIA